MCISLSFSLSLFLSFSKVKQSCTSQKHLYPESKRSETVWLFAKGFSPLFDSKLSATKNIKLKIRSVINWGTQNFISVLRKKPRKESFFQSHTKFLIAIIIFLCISLKASKAFSPQINLDLTQLKLKVLNLKHFLIWCIILVFKPWMTIIEKDDCAWLTLTSHSIINYVIVFGNIFLLQQRIFNRSPFRL